MATTITARFETRRDAETAVEHLVQEHGIDRNAVHIVAADEANTAGTQVAGADVEAGGEKTDTEGEPALEGAIAVSATVDDGQTEAVTTSFETYGGTELSA